MASSLDHLASRTRIEWLSGLDTEFRPAKNYRRTLVCVSNSLTFQSSRDVVAKALYAYRSQDKFCGEDQYAPQRCAKPWLRSYKTLLLTALAGLNVVRMNFSHGSYEVI